MSTTKEPGRLASELSAGLGPNATECDVLAQLRLRILKEHGGKGDGWQHHWNLTHGDSIMHREAVAEIERMRAALVLADAALEIGEDAVSVEAENYHVAMKGYRPHEHARLDAEVKQIADALLAVQAALGPNVAIRTIVVETKSSERERWAEQARAMHAADDAYGTGFYNSLKWRQHYMELRRMCGIDDGPNARLSGAGTASA